ncbi:T9SS type A sorting domain-containing protein [Mangrovimonas futianensis]|uniref:T9SS type A sorting domain-containing protein n=1 Tax=Mangrovimonas futianensis TaxID=2895523 RepID=UPI001E4CB48D|nr:T9SS type A sorting domain-containing protein [Mangrovimonas futianensis]MCF1421713.1 T9SS type A sorting domain-containing protein [Mangrovimonas futianensis]
MKKITFIFALFSCISFAQEYTYIDFGITTNETEGNWNNFSVANAVDADGLSGVLIDSNGASTGVTLTIDDAFDTVNTAGNPTPDASLPFPSSAAADSFFGETSTFNGSLEATGGFTLTGLDPSFYYSFSIFASRNGVSDNRETQYTVAGSTTEVVALNTSNNTANTADAMNIQPNGSGEITFTAEPGPNNDNSFGFYYLGAIEIIKSDAPLSVSDFKLKNMLSLYPNPVTDILEVRMDLKESSQVKMEIYNINGSLVSKLLDAQQPAGNFQFTWDRYDNQQISSGVYFLRMQVNDSEQTTKLILK